MVGCFFRLYKHSVHIGGNVNFVHLTRRPADPRQIVDKAPGFCLNRLGGKTHFDKKLGNKAVFLGQKGQKKVLLFQHLVAVFGRIVLCALDGFQRFLGIFICIHSNCLLAIGDSTEYLGFIFFLSAHMIQVDYE